MIASNAEIDAAFLRRRAAKTLAEVVGGEAMVFTFRRANGVDYYHGPAGTGHLRDYEAAANGQPAYGGAINEEQPDGWSVDRPKPVHTNRFARLEEDQDLNTMTDQESWKILYEPAGIRDQARALFYADGEFIGWAASMRGERRSYSDDEVAVLNRRSVKIWDDLKLAASLDAKELGLTNPPLQLVVTDTGRIDYATEAAAAWLTPDRARAIVAITKTGSQRLIDGMHVSATRLAGFPGHLACLTASTRRRVGMIGLSRTQEEIAKLAMSGLPNSEIASVLGVSQSTVKYHLRKVFSQFGIDARVELNIG